MGQVKSVFTDKQLEDYQDLTYLTKVEILRAYDCFNALLPPEDRNHINPVLNIEVIMGIPELKVNPFKDRICKVFSSGDEQITFEDFLDMMSVFSAKASKSVKTEYAFRIFDFDEDDYLSVQDIEKTVRRIIGSNELDEIDLKEVVDNVLLEADLDNDSIVNYAEFEHIVAKLPDFESNFRIRL